MKCEFSEEELFDLVVSVRDRENIAKNFIPINNVDRKLITQALTKLAALRTKIDTLLQQAESTHPIVQELEAQDDLREELLRFCRFLRAEGYIPCQQQELGVVNFDCPDFEELVEKALQAGEVDWFARAQHSGYAQDGGSSHRAKNVPIQSNASDAWFSVMNEAQRLVTDACYLLNTEIGVEVSEAERQEWRDRWLRQAEAYLESIGGDT